MPNLNGKAVSLDEQSGMVRHEFEEMIRHQREAYATNGIEDCCYCYVMEVYTDYIVVCEGVGEYYKVPYTTFTVTTDADGVETPTSGIQFAERANWQAVEKEWVAAKSLDAFVVFGGAVKALGDGKIGGYLVRFGSPDETDISPMHDYFTAETDFDIDDGDNVKSTVYYQHGLDPILKRRKLSKATLKKDEFGVWAETQLQLRDSYEQFIYQMAESGKMGWSSGVPSHLIERVKVGNAHHIKTWPLGLDASLTPNPAEPRNAAMPLKSLTISPLELPEAEPEAELPETAQAVVDAVVADEPNATVVIESVRDIPTMESETMTENQQPPVDSLEAKMNAYGAKLDSVLKRLEDMPISQNPGYITADGGKADKNIKSFGDYLVAVRRGDVKRLEEVYEVKALSEDAGGSGGYTVPEQYEPRLLEVAAQNSQIVAQLDPMPVTSPTGKMPALDMFFTPTAGDGQTAFAGGLNASTIAEGGAYSSSDPGFELVEWRINKIGFKTTVSNELMSDSPISMEALLTRLAGIAIGAKTERHVLRGTGAGEPLGIINAPATVSQSAASSNTFAYVDASNMISKHLATSNKVFWLMHKSTIPDITRFEVGTGGAVWIANVSSGMGSMPLLGYNIIFSEHLPKADSSGHVILADLGAYLLFVKGGISVAYSEHADFGNGNVVWRFDRRLDGQPWMKAAVTDANPGGSYTTSPFVQFTN